MQLFQHPLGVTNVCSLYKFLGHVCKDQNKSLAKKEIHKKIHINLDFLTDKFNLSRDEFISNFSLFLKSY